MKEKVTAWFSCKQHKPQRRGYYDWSATKSDRFPTRWRQFWNGETWQATPTTTPYCASEQKYGYWRGVKK